MRTLSLHLQQTLKRTTTPRERRTLRERNETFRERNALGTKRNVLGTERNVSETERFAFWGTERFVRFGFGLVFDFPRYSDFLA